MIIRTAAARDAAAIASVHVRSWQAAYRDLLPQEFLDQLDPKRRIAGWERTIRQADWPRATTLVAEVGADLVGFVDIRPARDDDRDPSTVGEVTSIYVLPEVFGTGVGRGLMTTATETLARAGFAQATLWVLAGNARATRFYLAAGWQADGASKRDEIAGQPITETRYEYGLSGSDAPRAL